ncbi:hypothetical protein [Gordonia sp. NPDC003376]
MDVEGVVVVKWARSVLVLLLTVTAFISGVAGVAAADKVEPIGLKPWSGDSHGGSRVSTEQGGFIVAHMVGRTVTPSSPCTVYVFADGRSNELQSRVLHTNGKGDGSVRLGPFLPGVYDTVFQCFEPGRTDVRRYRVTIDVTKFLPGGAPTAPNRLASPTDYCKWLAYGVDESLTPDPDNITDLPLYFVGSVGGPLVAGMKTICGGIASASGRQAEAEQMVCEAFISATWGLAGGRLTRLPKPFKDQFGHWVDLVDPVGQMERAAKNIPGLGDVLTDKACKSDPNYPTNAGLRG